MIRRIERYDFMKMYGLSPRKLIKAEKNEPVRYGSHILRVQKKEANGGEVSAVTFQEGREWYRLDLTSHWERGAEGPIRFSHDGASALAKAVLKQTADDLTEIYMGDYSSIKYIPAAGEKDTAKRYRAYVEHIKRECENLLGSVMSRYCKVRAYWNLNYDIADIADSMGETPEHIANIIYRLGLDRSTDEESDIVD